MRFFNAVVCHEVWRSGNFWKPEYGLLKKPKKTTHTHTKTPTKPDNQNKKKPQTTPLPKQQQKVLNKK